MKKLILAGSIFVLMMAGMREGMAANYPTGQATVTLVTPFNGIAKYSSVGQQYVNELSAGAGWGLPLDAVKWSTRANIGAINSTTGNALSKATTLVVGKAASASLVAVAIQAGLLVGATYFGDWLEEETLELWGDPLQVVDPTQVELPPEIPEGATVWWDGTSGYGVGATYCGPPTLVSPFQVRGFYTSIAAAEAACQAAKGSACGTGNLWNYSYCGAGWEGWGSLGYNTGYHTTWNDFVYTNNTEAHAHIVSTAELGTPVPLTPEEMRDRIEAAFDSGMPARQSRAMQMSQGAMAALAPYINESNRDFPVSHNPTPSGTPSLTAVQIAEAQNAIDDSIDTSDAEQVEDQSASMSGETDWEYTPQELAKAQNDYDKQLDRERKAEYDTYENTVPDYNATIVEPEKEPIRDKLDTFRETLEGEGIVAALAALGEVKTGSASCTLQADLGQWGNIEFSFCEWSDEVTALGVVMLGFCTFLWAAWFFMGRGDA